MNFIKNYGFQMSSRRLVVTLQFVPGIPHTLSLGSRVPPRHTPSLSVGSYCAEWSTQTQAMYCIYYASNI